MTSTTPTLTRAQARRIVLAAQGFTDPPHDPATLRTLTRTVQRTGVLQVDSVNVLQRAHFMPLYSRMGAYDPDLLRRAAEQRPRRLVEYWAHVQALMPVELWPLMRHRMDHYRTQRGKWGFVASAPELERTVLEQVRDAGRPVTASELDDGLPRAKDNWGWNWSEARKVLDYLFLVGDVAIAGRTPSFEPRYDVPERVLPADVLAAPTPTREEAGVELVRRAARSLGVASAVCLRDYYRMPVDLMAGSIAALEDAGEIEPVAIEGWTRKAWRHRDARLPRRVSARALLSPFDPVVWERSRTEAIFDFRYRIEIYTPAPRRVHGYYVLPFLLGDRIVGRVDLKADRKAGVLLVPGAFAEPDAPTETAEELAAELWRLAGWLGLDDVVVEAQARGDLSGRLAPALTSVDAPA